MKSSVLGVLLVVAIACASPAQKRAEDLRQRGDTAGAIEELERAVAESPESASANLALGEALVDAKRFDDAVAPLEKAQSLDPNDRTLLAMVAARFGQGRLEDAARIMDEVLGRSASAENYLRMGLIRLAQRRSADAIAALDTAVRMDPKRLEAVGALGRALSLAGRHDEAVSTLEGVLAQMKKQTPVTAEFRVALAHSYLALGREDDSYREMRLAASADPKNDEAQAGVGAALRRRKEIDQAIEHLKSAEAKHPRSAAVQYELGLAYRDFELREQAMQALEKAIKLDPSLGAAYGPLITMLEEANAPPDRVYGVLQPAAEKLTEDFDVQLRFGRLALARKRYGEAVRAIGRALEVKPNDVDANYALGLAQLGAGKIEEAQESYRALQTIDEAKAAELAERIAKASEPAIEEPPPAKVKEKKKGRSKKRRGR